MFGFYEMAVEDLRGRGALTKKGGRERSQGGALRKGDHGRKNKKQKGENVPLQKLGRDHSEALLAVALVSFLCGSSFV